MKRFNIILCLIFAPFFIFALVGLIDSLTIEDVGEESVPCLDKFGRPFEDEMCTKEITCSALAFFGNADYRCSEYDAILGDKE